MITCPILLHLAAASDAPRPRICRGLRRQQCAYRTGAHPCVPVLCIGGCRCAPPEYKQQTTDVSCAAASGAGRRRPIFFHSPMVHSEEGSGIPLQHVDETDPRASGDWRSPRTLPTKPARFVPRGDGGTPTPRRGQRRRVRPPQPGPCPWLRRPAAAVPPAVGLALGYGSASRLFSHRCGKITG